MYARKAENASDRGIERQRKRVSCWIRPQGSQGRVVNHFLGSNYLPRKILALLPTIPGINERAISSAILPTILTCQFLGSNYLPWENVFPNRLAHLPTIQGFKERILVL